MTDLKVFIDAILPATGRDINSNKEQLAIVTAPPESSIKIVAGPGSGKTTVIVLRLLKLVIVDGISPEQIIATTFTVKASKELRSRILLWGIKIREEVLSHLNTIEDVSEKERLHRVNFDKIKVGTLDALAEEILTDEARANQDPPTILPDFIAKHFMISQWFSQKPEVQTGIAEEFVKMGFNKYGIESNSGAPVVSGIVDHLIDFHNRLLENSIDTNALKMEYPNVATILEEFNKDLSNRKLLDFPALEQRFLEFITSEESDGFFDNIQVLMVDEYQDTNLLQERIYGGIVRRIAPKGGCFTVVGDDDQSIYRFRGSRVHLFTDIEERFKKYGVDMKTEFLSVNYRSSENIVRFCNDFIKLDPVYQQIRVKNKPDMSVDRDDGDDFPVFGIFREDVTDLAKEITNIVRSYAYHGLYVFKDTDGNTYDFMKSPGGGLGDAVLLMSSTKNVNSTGKYRLPAFLKEYMSSGPEPIKIFNPRGTKLCEDEDIVLLAGTLIHCIDKDYKLLQDTKMDKASRKICDRWKSESLEYINDATPWKGVSLKTVVDSWSSGTPYPKDKQWKEKNVPVLEILYSLLPWFPNIRNDAESLVLLQAVFNAISDAAIVRNNELTIDFDKDTHLPIPKSVKRFYNYVIRPLLEDTLDTDETLFFSVTSDNRFDLMTIHQAKGLEFPIVFVDVSSDFRGDYTKQRVKRFPDTLDSTSITEKVLSEYNNEIRTRRSELDMQFDDLIRKNFVAFSRAQDVLILVGLKKSVEKDGLKNIATGWTRDGEWRWKRLDNIKMLSERHD